MQQFTGTKTGNKTQQFFKTFPSTLRWLFVITFFLFASLVSNNVKAQFSAVPVTGFNADVVADGTTNVDATATTTAPVDGTGTGANFVFTTNTFKPSAAPSVCNTANGWPASITSSNTTTNTGITYTFQSSIGNNSLRVTNGTPLDLTLVTPTSASSFYIVCLGGQGATTFTATFNFSDATSETVSGTAPDWCGGAATNKLPNATTPSIFYRIPRTNTTCTGGGTCQYMYELALPLSVANYLKTINSITFTNTATGVFLHVLAVGKRATCTLPADGPTALTQGATTSGSIAASFTAAASAPNGYLVVRYPSGGTPVNPVNATTYVANQPLGTGTVIQSGAATSFTASILTSSTTYDFYIYPFNSGASCGGPIYNPAAVLFGSLSTPACSGLPGGIYPVGPTGVSLGGFASITSALTTINAGITGPIILELQSAYNSSVETFPIVFPYNACVGPVNTLTIRPEAAATGLSITSNNTTGTINFNGGSYITIDGRPGGTGTVSQLTIANTNAGTSYALNYTGDASNNTVNYCTVTSRNASATSGTIVFGAGGVTGNDNNTISNSVIQDDASGSFPVNAIYSAGTSAAIDNSNNTISNNLVSNYFSATLVTSGILLTSTGNSGWTITNNKLFQAATRTYTSAQTHFGISIQSGAGYTISGNTIGFSNSAGSGTTNMVGNSAPISGFPTSYIVAGTVNATRYTAINCAFTAAGTNSLIQSNTIAAFAFYSSNATATANGTWCAIAVTSGNATIGGASGSLGNTIGATSGQGSIYLAETANSGPAVGIYATSANTVTISNNTIGAIDVSGTTSSVTGAFTGIDAAGAGIFSITNNTIGNTTAQNIRTGYLVNGANLTNSGGTFTSNTSTAGALIGIRHAATGSTVAINNNTLRGWANSTTAGGALTGITSTGAVTSSVTINANALGTSGLGWMTWIVANTGGAVTGINATGATSATSHSIQNNDFTGIVYSVSGTSAHTYINITGATAAANTTTISNNTFTNLNVNTTANVTFISHSYTVASTGIQTINNNSIVTAFSKGGAGGTVTCLTSAGSSATGAVITHTNNNFSSITVTGATAINGIANTDGSTNGPTKTVTGNTFNNWTGGSSAITAISYATFGGSSSVSNNSVSNITSQGAITAINIGATGNLANPLLISGNTINSLTSNGTGGAVTGIACTNTSPVINITGHAIFGLSTTAGAVVTGISVGGATQTNVFKNSICNLSGTAAGSAVNGILVSAGTTVSIYNNRVAGLTAAAANGANQVIGLNITGGTTVNGYYNSVVLSGTSSGAAFGSSAVSAATGTTLTLRNNIFVNNTTPVGTGLAVAYRRSTATLTSYTSASNNNLFYAGTPGSNNLVYNDGTNSDQTIGAYKSRVAPKDGSSVSENPPFLSTVCGDANFLKINTGTPTLAEGNGAAVGGITDDFEGDTRNATTPDIGADEFTGTPVSVVVINSVSASPSVNQCAATARVITANITAGASNITTVTLNYQFNGGTSTQLLMTGGNPNAGQTSDWTATIPVQTPANATVTWFVTAADGTTSKLATGTSYTDAPLTGITATATATLSTVCAGSPTSLSVMLGGAAPSYTNPPAVVNPTTDEDFGNITITQGATTILNNTTAGGSLIGTIGTATGTGGSYSNFTAFGPYYLTPGVTYSLSLTSITQGGSFGNAMAVWIDYNRNGSFGDAGENVFTQGTITGPHTSTGTFTVPAAASPGLARMRVLVNEGAITGPTQTPSWGEYEEYTVNLAPAITGVSWSDGTNEVGTTNPLSVSPTTNTSYTATVSALGCTVNSNAVAITAIALPTAPGANNSTQCGTGTPGCFVSGGSAGNYRWYLAPTGGTALSGQFNAALSGYSINTTTHFYVSITNGTCESSRTDVLASVNAADPVQAFVDNNNICLNGSIQLSATQTPIDPNSPNNYIYTWTAPAGAGIPTSVTGNPVTVTPTAAGTFTYTVTANDATAGCTNVSTVVVTVKSLPVIASATATAPTVCAGVSSTLNGAGQPQFFNIPVTGYNFDVVANGTGLGSASTTADLDGSNILVASDWNFSGACAALTNFMPVSGQVTGNATVVGGSLTYILQPYNANNALRIPATATGGGAGSGTLTLTTPTSANKLFLLYIVGNGPITSGVTVTVNFTDATTQVFSNLTAVDWFNNPNPAIANVGRINKTTAACQTTTGTAGGPNLYDLAVTLSAGNTSKLIQSITVQVATAGTPTMAVMAVGGFRNSVPLNWSWNPGSLSGSSVVVTPSTTTTYTATATDPSTGCSNTATATVTVNPLPPLPSANDGTGQCGTAVSDMNVSSNNSTDPQVPAFFKWYDAATGGVLKQSGTSTIYTTAISTTTTLYVSEVSANGCEGPRVEITTVVSDADPITVNATPTSVCLNGSTDISASYTSSFNSYATYTLTGAPANSGVTGTVSLTPNGTGDGTVPFTVTPTATGTFTYTITANDPDKGCTAVNTVTVTVNPNPVIDSIRANPSAVCAGVSSNLSVYSGSVSTGPQTLLTYTAPGTTTSTSSDNIVLVNFQSINNATTTGGTNGYVDYTSLPAPTINSGSTYPITVNVNNGGTEFAAVWFDWNRNGVYDASEFTNIPVSLATTWNGTVNITVPANAAAGVIGMRVRSKFSTALTSADAYSSYSFGETEDYKVNVIGVVTQNPSYTYSWVAPGPVSAGSTATITVGPLTSTTYSVTVTGSGCSASSSVTLTVNQLPAAPATNDPVTRCGPGSVTLTATGSGGTLNWYNVASGGTSLQTGGTYTTNVTSGTSYWVAETSAAGCAGPRSQVHVNVTTPPTLAITPGGATSFCAGSGVTLNGATASDPGYTNFTWSANPSSGAGLSSTTGASITVTPTTAATYTITLNANDGSPTGCANVTTIVVTMNPNPVTSTIIASPNAVCSGGTVTLTGQPQYMNVPVTGYNIDVVANGVGAVASSTTGDLDNVYTLAASDWNFDGSCAALPSPNFMPVSGTIAANSSVASGLVYNLQPYTGLNDLRIPASGTGITGTGTFTLVTPTKMATLYLLYGAGNGPITSGITVTVTFTDATTQVFSNLTALDWFATTNPAISNVGRVNRSTAACQSTTTTTGPQFFDMVLALNASNYSKPVQSIKIDKTVTTGIMNVIAVGMKTEQQIAGTVNWSWNPGNLSGNPVTVTPSVTTTYTATATSAAGCSGSNTVTVTVGVGTATATATPSTPVCAGTSVTLNAGATGTAPLSYSWASTPAGTYPANASINVNPLVTTTYTVTVTDGCTNTITSTVTVTVNPLPTASIQEGPGPISICSPASQVLHAVTDAGSASYQWTLNGTNISGATASSYTVSGISSGAYRVIVTNTATNCVSAVSSPVTVTINYTPTGVSAGASAGVICNGTPINLTSAADAFPSTILTQNFSSGLGSWTAVNNTTGGSNAAATAWTIQASPFTSANTTAVTFNSGAGNFILSNADIGGSGTSINTILTSPTFSTMNYTSLNLAFRHFYHFLSTTEAFVEVSTNGSTWTSVKSYTADQGTAAAFASESINLNAYINNPSLQVRFRYQDGWSWYWAIDDIAVTGAGVTYSYNWTSSPAGFTSTVQNPTGVAPSTTTTYSVTISTAAGCSTTATTTVTVNPRPTATISGTGAFCQGAANTSTNLTVTFTGTAPWNYTYTTDGGSPVSGTTSSNPLTITVSPSSASAHVFTYAISALSDALCTAIEGDFNGTATVTINPLAAAPTATVSVQPTCSVGTGTVTVTNPLGSGNSYTLDGTTTINWPTVNFTGVAPGLHTITVTNAFGCSAPASTTVTVDPQPFIPGAPVVTGIVNVCPYLGVGPNPGTQVTYHATATGNGTQLFNWVIPPSNVAIVSGQGTPDLTVTFTGNYVNNGNKQIRLTVTNQCGTSPLTIFYTVTQLPGTPQPITGPTSVCNLIGTATPATYFIHTVSATGYNWTVPANTTVNHPNGPGVNDTLITLTFQAGFTGGNVTVTASNDCGTSGTRSLAIAFAVAATPGPINGPTNACAYTAPLGTAASYSVTPVSTATSYTWTAPAGAIVTHPNGSGANDNTITVLYPAGFTSGTVTVTSTNGCGTSGVRSLSITKLNPATPGVIDVVQTRFCGDVNGRAYTYALATLPANAATVNWTVPVGATFINITPIKIEVTYPDGPVTGAVTAQGVNASCTSAIRSSNVLLPACPPPGFVKTGTKGSTVAAVKGMEVKIFPNPTVSDFKLEVITARTEEITVRVLDNLGRLYKSFKVMPYQTIALGAELKAGSYLVEVRQGTEVKTTKVIKF